MHELQQRTESRQPSSSKLSDTSNISMWTDIETYWQFGQAIEIDFESGSFMLMIDQILSKHSAHAA